MALGPQKGIGCVADSEHLGESTGSTGQVWSTNFGTQPLTISCGFPAPYLVLSPRGPGTFEALGSASAHIAVGTTDRGARGWSLKSHVTGVTGVTGVTEPYNYMILNDFLFESHLWIALAGMCYKRCRCYI